ncbi:MAG: hypothetical protein KF799_05810 [Bdellovibrionales bacterium]|nr:hypothetical protein [Bdellovibrionales bacterium]
MQKLYVIGLLALAMNSSGAIAESIAPKIAQPENAPKVEIQLSDATGKYLLEMPKLYRRYIKPMLA